MREKLTIKNFGGIQNISIELNSFNILIGPQASGKSITAKLFFYFKSFPDMLFNSAEDEDMKREFDLKLSKRFEEYFPIHSWPQKDFNIKYEIEDLFIEVSRLKSNKISIKYSSFFKNELLKYRRNIIKFKQAEAEKEDFDTYRRPYRLRERYLRSLSRRFENYGSSQFFIPAGRSFYANLQSSIFSFLSSNKAIDPFLIEFGSFYESIKGYEERRFGRIREKDNADINLLFEAVLCGKYLREKDKDFLVHKDKRKINLSYASSGQQETLPLALILRALESIRFSTGGATIFIEEPEAHLFPLAQKLIVEFIAHVYNQSKSKLQFVITTHSPYILASINNLMHAGALSEKIDENQKIKLHEIISEKIILKPSSVNAFSLKSGFIESLICEETKLISQSILDSVSDDIAIQFDKLLDF